MPKQTIEFNCYVCSHYLYPRMNISLDGNYIVNCPVCGHQHYRTIRDGYITSDRFDQNLPLCNELIIPKSAAVPYSKRRHRGLVATAREM
jgi:transcription elongation factor Elf1